MNSECDYVAITFLSCFKRINTFSGFHIVQISGTRWKQTPLDNNNFRDYVLRALDDLCAAQWKLIFGRQDQKQTNAGRLVLKHR